MHQWDCKCEDCRPQWWIEQQTKAIEKRSSATSKGEVLKAYEKVIADLSRQDEHINKIVRDIRGLRIALSEAKKSNIKVVKSEPVEVKPAPVISTAESRAQDASDKIEILEADLADREREKKQAVVFLGVSFIPGGLALTLFFIDAVVGGGVFSIAYFFMLGAAHHLYFNNTTDIKQELMTQRQQLNRANLGLPPVDTTALMKWKDEI